jgi:hypothetical protein
MKIEKVNELKNNLQLNIKNRIDEFDDYRGIGETADGFVIFLYKDNKEIRNILENEFPGIEFDIQIGEIKAF